MSLKERAQALARFWKAAQAATRDVIASQTKPKKEEVLPMCLYPCAWDDTLEILVSNNPSLAAIVVSIIDDDLTLWHVRLSYGKKRAPIQVNVIFAPNELFPVCRVLHPKVTASFVINGVICLADLGVASCDFNSLDALNLMLQTIHAKLEDAEVDASPGAAYTPEDYAAGERTIRLSHAAWFRLSSAEAATPPAAAPAPRQGQSSEALLLTSHECESWIENPPIAGSEFKVDGEVALFDPVVVASTDVTLHGNGRSKLVGSIIVKKGGICRVHEVNVEGNITCEDGGRIEMNKSSVLGLIEVRIFGSSIKLSSCTLTAVYHQRVLRVLTQASAFLDSCKLLCDAENRGGGCKVESDSRLEATKTEFQAEENSISTLFGSLVHVSDCTFSAPASITRSTDGFKTTCVTAAGRSELRLAKCNFVGENLDMAIFVSEASKSSVTECSFYATTCHVKESKAEFVKCKFDGANLGTRNAVLATGQAVVVATDCHCSSYPEALKAQTQSQMTAVGCNVTDGECGFISLGSHVSLERCTFTECLEGTHFESSTGTLTGCKIVASSKVAVVAMKGANVRVNGNTSIQGPWGFEVMRDSTCTVDGVQCQFSGCGLIVRDTSKLIVKNARCVASGGTSPFLAELHDRGTLTVEKSKTAGLLDVGVKCHGQSTANLSEVTISSCRVGLIAASDGSSVTATNCVVHATACSVQALEGGRMTVAGGQYHGRKERDNRSTIDANVVFGHELVIDAPIQTSPRPSIKGEQDRQQPKEHHAPALSKKQFWFFLLAAAIAVIAFFPNFFTGQHQSSQETSQSAQRAATIPRSSVPQDNAGTILLIDLRDSHLAAVAINGIEDTVIDVINARTSTIVHDDTVIVEKSGLITPYEEWAEQHEKAVVPAGARIFFQLRQYIGRVFSRRTNSSTTPWYSAETRDGEPFVCLGPRCVSVIKCYATHLQRLARLAAKAAGVPSIRRAHFLVSSDLTVHGRLQLAQIAEESGFSADVSIDTALHPVVVRGKLTLSVFVDSNSVTADIYDEVATMSSASVEVGEMSVVRCLMKRNKRISALSALAHQSSSGLPAKLFVEKLQASVLHTLMDGTSTDLHVEGESATLTLDETTACLDGLHLAARRAVQNAIDNFQQEPSAWWVDEDEVARFEVIGRGSPQHQLAPLAEGIHNRVLAKKHQGKFALRTDRAKYAGAFIDDPLVAVIRAASLKKELIFQRLNRPLVLGEQTEKIDFDGVVLTDANLLSSDGAGPWFKVDVSKPVVFYERVKSEYEHDIFAFGVALGGCKTDKTSVKRSKAVKSVDLDLARIQVTMETPFGIPKVSAPCKQLRLLKAPPPKLDKDVA